MRLLVVRHGVTDWNVQGRLQGRTDVALNPEGLRQAEALMVRLRGEPIARLLSSPTRRAMATAAPLAAARGLRIETDEDLHEGHMGLWEGLTWEEIRVRYPDQLAERERVGPSYRGHGGESILDVAARAARAFERIQAGGGACVAVVTHAALARHLIVHATRDDRHLALRLRNTAVSELEIPVAGAPARLRLLDDLSHLEAGSGG